MRGWRLLVAALTLGGCVAPTAEEQAEAAADTPPAQGIGLRAAPRALDVPAGSSYHVVWLNATAADWFKWGDIDALFVGFDLPDAAELEAFGFLLFEADDGTAAWRSAHVGASGRGAGGLVGGPPRAASFLALLAVDNASSPFEMRFGAYDDVFDDEFEGASVAADVVESGRGASVSSFVEWDDPLLSGGGDLPRQHNVKVEDSRVKAPSLGAAVAAAGTLRVAFDHPTPSRAVAFSVAYADAFLGARAARWATTWTTDEDARASHGALIATPVGGVPFLAGGILGADAKSWGGLAIEDAAAALPLTLLQAVTVPFDPATVGLNLDEFYVSWLPLPVALTTRHGCVDLRAPAAPSLAACALAQR